MAEPLLVVNGIPLALGETESVRSWFGTGLAENYALGERFLSWKDMIDMGILLLLLLFCLIS
jgi:hypothetical protein